MNSIDLKLVFFSRKRVPLASCFALFSLMILVGCGGAQNTDGPPRYQLEGTVLFEGNPVPKGEITFRPDASTGNQGPGGYATIDQGKFKIESDKGVVGGDYIFTITGYDGIPIPGSDVGEPIQNGKTLFANVEIKKVLPKNDSKIDLEIPLK